MLSVIRLMLSVWLFTKVITLSNLHCIINFIIELSTLKISILNYSSFYKLSVLIRLSESFVVAAGKKNEFERKTGPGSSSWHNRCLDGKQFCPGNRVGHSGIGWGRSKVVGGRFVLFSSFIEKKMSFRVQFEMISCSVRVFRLN